MGGGEEWTTSTSTRRVRAFKRWMNSNGFQCSDALQISDSPHRGLSVVALCDLREGDLVATIPKRSCLTVKTSAASDLVSFANLDGYLGLSVALMFERSLGDLSPWAPYLRLLPFHECLPLVWSVDEVDSLLRGTELHKTVKQDMALIYDDWKESILPLLELKHFHLDPSFFGVQDYFAAKTLIASRSFEIDSYHGFGMVPLADLFNHKTAAEDVHFTSVDLHSRSKDEDESDGMSGLTDSKDDESEEDQTSQISPTSNAELHIALSEENALHDNNVEQPLDLGDDSVSLEMIMVKDVKVGDEVYNTYGLLGNAALLHRYGFTEPNNPFDIVNIDMELVVQWSNSLFSSRYSRSRVSLWRRLGYSGCVSEDSEYFEISYDGEAQMELLILLYIMFLPEDSYSKLDFAVSTSGTLEDLKGDVCTFLSRGTSKVKSGIFMTKNVGGALLLLADMRDGLYGTSSLEDDTIAVKQCCPIKDRRLYHSLMLRISERTILKKLRSYIANATCSIDNKRASTRKKSKRNST